MDLPDTALVDSADLAALMGVATSTVMRWSRNGDMPQGRRVGPRLLKWNRKEIEAWIKEGCPKVNGATK